MLLRYDGTQAKFSRHGQTWKPGDIIDVEISAQDAAWMLRHGFTQLFTAVPAKVEEAQPQQDTFVSMHGAFVEQPEKLAASLSRTLGRRGRK